jgi:hypothetical protein
LHTHSVTHTTSSSDLETFFSFFIGKIMTVGIVSLSAIEGIGAQSVHSSESVAETGVVVCPVSLADITKESLPRHRLYSQIEVDIPNTTD